MVQLVQHTETFAEWLTDHAHHCTDACQDGQHWETLYHGNECTAPVGMRDGVHDPVQCTREHTRHFLQDIACLLDVRLDPDAPYTCEGAPRVNGYGTVLTPENSTAVRVLLRADDQRAPRDHVLYDSAWQE